MQIPSMARAGTWKVMDFPPPVGISARVSSPGKDRMDDFFLQGAEFGISPERVRMALKSSRSAKLFFCNFATFKFNQILIQCRSPRIKSLPKDLTFDDVLLLPAYSEVLPREVDIKSQFSRNIMLNTPIVSAAMDTVTEEKLAITIAREGGIGVIHKNMPLEEQASQVRRVKRAESVMIHEPITISKEGTVSDALNLMKEYKIGGIPVVDENNILIGIVTNRDLRFQQDMDRSIDEVMTKDNIITTTQNTTWQKRQNPPGT